MVLAIGAAAVTGGVLLLLSFGRAFTLARLLQTTRRVSVAEAIELARSTSAGGPAQYVRVTGRVDSDHAFPDEHNRPLVFRWTRLQVAGHVPGQLPNTGAESRGWTTVEETRERVPFAVQQGLDAIFVRDDELGEGLVVVPRESKGDAAQIAGRLPETVRPGTAVRLRIDQVSAVEHAAVLGVPALAPNGVPFMTAGRGRPLILTTLEDPEAMRILAADAPRRPLAVATLLATGVGLLVLGTAWAAVRVLVGP